MVTLDRLPLLNLLIHAFFLVLFAYFASTSVKATEKPVRALKFVLHTRVNMPRLLQFVHAVRAMELVVKDVTQRESVAQFREGGDRVIKTYKYEGGGGRLR